MPTKRATAGKAKQAPVLYSYSVKFVCGTQKVLQPENCSTVRPGVYATDINIHNTHIALRANIRKNFLVLVKNGEVLGREPNSVKGQVLDSMTLKADHATMDDCCRITQLLHIPPASAITIGFLEIISDIELNVTAVYTVTDQSTRAISMDVETIAGKRKVQ